MFFSTKTITVEFGCSIADRPKVFADLSTDIRVIKSYVVNFKIDILTFFRADSESFGK